MLNISVLNISTVIASLSFELCCVLGGLVYVWTLDNGYMLVIFREGVHWTTEGFLFSWFNFHALENFFLVLSPHLNHFRPVEANANKFPDIYKSRNRIPSFFYQILSTLTVNK